MRSIVVRGWRLERNQISSSKMINCSFGKEMLDYISPVKYNCWTKTIKTDSWSYRLKTSPWQVKLLPHHPGIVRRNDTLKTFKDAIWIWLCKVRKWLELSPPQHVSSQQNKVKWPMARFFCPSSRQWWIKVTSTISERVFPIRVFREKNMEGSNKWVEPSQLAVWAGHGSRCLLAVYCRRFPFKIYDRP